ncbi:MULTISPECIES: prenyltransferase/squalene oxidase repeat-containing protein [unclassified Marinovum]
MLTLTLTGFTATGAAPLLAQDIDPGLKQEAEAAVDSGLDYLRGQQGENGAYLDSVGVTALVLNAFVTQPGGTDQSAPLVQNATAYLLSQVQKDGSITESIQNRNYNTATAVTALSALDDPAVAEAIAGARGFLGHLQLSEANDYPADHPYYGGIGYGGDERPDLSNIYYALEALEAAGVPDDDPVVQRAMQFVSRSQNNSETNDQAWAGNDGGFTYMPGESEHAGTGSYGGMTHVGLISLIYAGADKSDPRVQAAYDWIRANYTVETNPGTVDDQGLFFYYEAFSKSMTAYGETTVTDTAGVAHNWRDDLAGQIVSIQGDDGAWVNTSPRWWEGLKPLVTARAINALNLTLTP